MTAGYSKTPLIKKLGIKSKFSVLLVNEPDHYKELLGELPEGAELVDPEMNKAVDFIHFFAENEAVLKRYFPRLKEQFDKEGMMWVSWIKKSSKRKTDIAKRDVRRLGLKLGLVDIKICSVDADWSALKFVYRKKDR